MARYKDIEDYGIIGNLETCALMGRDGSLDWLCLPYMESPSVFAAILDTEKGGHFCIQPVNEYESSQSYLGHTNVLLTKFTTALGAAEITDFMEVKGRHTTGQRTLFRKVTSTAGEVVLKLSFQPRFNYARNMPEFSAVPGGVSAASGRDRLFLQSEIKLDIKDNEVAAEFTLAAGKTAWFVLRYGQAVRLPVADCESLLEQIRDYWLRWSERSLYSKVGVNEPWKDIIVRSGLALQLLANPETGSIAAAATTSLPERLGGVRNWDYRYAWIRDASFTAQAFFHLDHLKEGKDFRNWIWGIISRYKDPSAIKIMYGLHSEMDIEEHILDNLAGYKDSSPVRIGNGAAGQRQLDIYGELINMVYETDRYGQEVPHKKWPEIRAIIDYVCKVWNTTDSGIWEVRGGTRHFVYSKLMCWVAVDRGIKIATKKGFTAPLADWEKVKEEIKQAVLERGFNKKLNSFVQSFDSEVFDATNLLIPVVGFLPPTDPRVLGTIEATIKNLLLKDCLVYRYKAEDGLPGTEGNFTLCSFWLVKALALAGNVTQAEDLFLKVLKYISPLGLFAEEIDSASGRQLGNFPQAFSHIGLINSALYIDMAKGKEVKSPGLMGGLREQSS